jgi:hypothetical protein
MPAWINKKDVKFHEILTSGVADRISARNRFLASQMRVFDHIAG